MSRWFMLLFTLIAVGPALARDAAASAPAKAQVEAALENLPARVRTRSGGDPCGLLGP